MTRAGTPEAACHAGGREFEPCRPHQRKDRCSVLLDPFLRQNYKKIENVTPEQIVTRMAMTDMLSWATPAPKTESEPTMDALSEAKRPDWVTKTRIERKK